jgi:hypothetical protein
MAVKACFGPPGGPIKHLKKCRPGRPYCRWRRKAKWGVCTCGCYHFPHRRGSGQCGNQDAMWSGLAGALAEEVPF